MLQETLWPDYFFSRPPPRRDKCMAPFFHQLQFDLWRLSRWFTLVIGPPSTFITQSRVPNSRSFAPILFPHHEIVCCIRFSVDVQLFVGQASSLVARSNRPRTRVITFNQLFHEHVHPIRSFPFFIFEPTQCRVFYIKSWWQWGLNPGHFGDWQWRWPLG